MLHPSALEQKHGAQQQCTASRPPQKGTADSMDLRAPEPSPPVTLTAVCCTVKQHGDSAAGGACLDKGGSQAQKLEADHGQLESIMLAIEPTGRLSAAAAAALDAGTSLTADQASSLAETQQQQPETDVAGQTTTGAVALQLPVARRPEATAAKPAAAEGMPSTSCSDDSS